MEVILADRTFLKGICKAVAILCVVSSLALGDYELVSHTIDGGGGTSSGGGYELFGTTGQPDAAYSACGRYELLGGFWPGGPLCFVDFRHIARFADHWLEAGCSDVNDWCGGADLDYLGDVDWADLDVLAEEWLNYCPYDWPLR